MELHGLKKTPNFKEFDPSRSVLFSIFLKRFPWKWLRLVLLVQTNKNLDQELHWGELLRYLRLWFLMSSVGGGYKKKDFWSTLPFDEGTNPCPCNFRKYMLLKSFDAITAALSFADANKPTYRNKFWEDRQLIAEWNKNMAEAFSPSWILCIDESMSIWHSRWTCPGWVFCPCKPHPCGNEYHSACCGMSGLMFAVEMVKGKTNLADSDWLLALIPGNAIDDRFVGKSPGECEAITGTLNASPYFIWGMKEPDYVMKIMATGGVLEEDGTCREIFHGSGDARTSFRYKKPFDWHFRYRHAVDNTTIYAMLCRL
eukprot:CCRYP_004791-RA/>CCRYP_004791-RA protein AED:0.45 eAED:0.46 QI:0/0/0/1/0/0.5/2/0/312